MRNLKTILAASTAMALAGAAWADDNEAYLDQKSNGNGNSALITQDGTGNQFATSNKAGVQNSKRAVADGNELTLTQTGNDNVVGSINFLQESNYGPANIVTIDQFNTGNRINGIDQRTLNPATTSENVITVTQGDEFGTAGGNVIGSIGQRANTGTGNRATVSMTGDNNRISLISQGANAGGNTANVTISGNDNGFGDLTGFSNVTFETPNDRPQDAYNSIRQGNIVSGAPLGGLNEATLDIGGDRNRFGVTQRGTSNTVNTLTITGSDNQLGVYQNGIANVVDAGVIEGIANNIGITQLNDDNFASVDVYGSSDDNAVSITQEDAFGTGGDAIVTIEGVTNGGDLNTVVISQQAWGFADVGIVGDKNDVSVTQFNADEATVEIGGIAEGSDNVLEIMQGQSASSNPNKMTVSIFGNRNNQSGGFSGSASSVATVATGYLSWNGLEPGELGQQGDGNMMSLEIGVDGGIQANDNLFAASQDGNDNTLTGVINGSMNQAVVAQMGNMNTAAFTQTGNGNNAGIIQ